MKKRYLLLLLSLLILLTSCIEKTDIKKEKVVDDKENSSIQANFANWGYVVSKENDIYYSKENHGIYKYNTEGEHELIISGRYSDMGIINNTLYCVEYITNEEGYDESTIVQIDLESKEKKVVYKQPSSVESSVWGSNIINGKYYFIVDDDNLLSVDRYGKVKDTQIRSARLITSDGVYTTEISDYGLKLVSMSGKIIKNYPEVSEFKVYVKFVLGDYIYLEGSKDNHSQLYRLNKETGKLSVFPENTDIYDRVSYRNINFYKDTFFICVTRYDSHKNSIIDIYSIDLQGNLENIYHEEAEGRSYFCTISIADERMFIYKPWSDIEPDIIKLDD